jgi:membrane protease YdiL (CAAX protease family)
MNREQKLAIIAPLILIGSMYPIFEFLPRVCGDRIGWYLGLVLYWLIWGGIFSLWIIGVENIRKIVKPQKLSINIFFLVLFPLVMAALYRLIPGMDYEKPSAWVFLLLLSTNFGNGFFEEVFWRGIYMVLFPDRFLFRILWPSIWFALWHFLPGSVFSDSNVMGLMVGSGLMGLYLSFLAKKTGTIWWTIVMHTLGGFIMIL